LAEFFASQFPRAHRPGGLLGLYRGFKEDQIADYQFSEKPEETFFYATGRWASTAEY
jgi:hypothetical protein